MEIWRQIPELNGYYEASSYGRIRRSKPGINTEVGRVKKLALNPNGYLQVATSIDGAESRHWVHRLVASAFIGVCPDGQQVNHKDGNQYNNNADNLEYVTPLENIKDKMPRKLRKLARDVRRWRELEQSNDPTPTR